MDTSEVYIKMSKNSDEIQDYFRRKNKDKGYKKEAGFYLPRQDQLQHMLRVESKYTYSKPRQIITLCHLFACGIVNDFDYSQYSGQFKTFEQFWLAFLMKELYNKIWKNNEWIEIKK